MGDVGDRNRGGGDASTGVFLSSGLVWLGVFCARSLFRWTAAVDAGQHDLLAIDCFALSPPGVRLDGFQNCTCQ